MTNGVFVGGGGPDYGEKQWLDLGYANRHGLIAGATGTGKTVTLQILAEGFSAAGVPVFMADVKGDLAGLAVAGSPEAKLHARLHGARRDDRLRRFCLRLPSRWRSGTFSANRAIRCAPPWPRWGRCCCAASGALRGAGRRAEHRVSRRRRRGPAAARPQGPARAAGLAGREPRRDGAALRQCLDRLGGRDPAAPAGAGDAGRREAFRRAGAGSGRSHAHGTRRSRAWSTSLPPTR